MNDLSGLPKERQRLLNRSTGGEFTPLAYLNIIQRGTLDEWVYLWQACNEDPETRQAVIDLLEAGDPHLKEEIARQGIAEITLFQLDDMVVLYSEVADSAAWDRLWASDVHHRWGSELMDPLMHYRDDGVIDSRELREIWHFAPAAE